MRIRSSTLMLVGLLLSGIAACSDPGAMLVPPRDAAADVRADSASADVTQDAGALDVPSDLATDAPADVAGDSVDAAADTAPDALVDIPLPPTDVVAGDVTATDVTDVPAANLDASVDGE